MKYLKITGNQNLTGEIQIQPAKNSILLAVVASLLTDEEILIDDYVDIIDLKHMLELLEEASVDSKLIRCDITAKSKILMKKNSDKIYNKNMSNCLFTKSISIPYENFPNIVYYEDKFTTKDKEKITMMSNEIYKFFGTDSISSSDSAVYSNVHVLSDVAAKIRTSILFWGAMLANGNSFAIKLPGGCNLGTRAYDMHIDALTQMGANIQEIRIDDDDYLFAKTNHSKLRGIEYTFRQVSVTGTANILMAATLADGETTLHNIAIEPEIINLIDLLKKMSANISFIGSRSIVIQGQEKLCGATHKLVPDRIEAGTYLIAGAALGQRLRVNIFPYLVESTLNVLSRMGVVIERHQDHVIISKSELHSIDVFTGPHPDFSTDLQPQLTALMTLADGKSRIFETMFDNRTCHVGELQKMGASIDVDGRVIIVNGASMLMGCDLNSYALRGSAAVVLAALFAHGESRVFGIEKLYRGYDNIVEKLSKCGAIIEECDMSELPA